MPSAQAAEEMRSAGREVLGIHADITRQEDVDRLFAQTIDRFGRLDVLVNNAGRSMRGKVLDTTPEQFRELMELNLIALVRCTRAADAALVAAARPRGQHRLAGGEIGRPMGRRLSGHQVRRGGLFAAIAAGTRPARAARAVGLPRAHRSARTPGSIRWQDLEDVPEAARGAGGGRAGAGHRRRRTWPGAILRACERRQPELVVPGKARLLFALSQLWPGLGDWIVRRKTGQ